MATHLEIDALLTGEDMSQGTDAQKLRSRVRAACLVVAEEIRANADRTQGQANWARGAFRSPAAVSEQALPAVLAANAGATLAQINGATDEQITTAVRNVVTLMSG